MRISCKVKLVRQKCDIVLSYYFSKDDTEKSLKMGPRQLWELSAAACHCQTSSIITDANSDPISPSITLHHPISSSLKSAHRIFAYMHVYNPSFMQVNQKRDCDRNTENSLTAYSSGVTFSTSNTTASKLFFSSEDALSLRDSELLLFWKSHTQKHTHKLMAGLLRI